MKNIIVSMISLLIGIGVGWGFGHTRPAPATKDTSPLKSDPYWSSPLASVEFSTAALATQTIGYIDSGETQRAIEHLTVSVAHFYTAFSLHPSTNEELVKLRDSIDELARTNQVVAASIGSKM